MAAHHARDRRDVGWAVGCAFDESCEFAEVIGAEDAGGDDRERPRVDVVRVVEVVDSAARDTESLAGADSVGVPSIVQVSTPSSP